jgi:hypothetical protein
MYAKHFGQEISTMLHPSEGRPQFYRFTCGRYLVTGREVIIVRNYGLGARY